MGSGVTLLGRMMVLRRTGEFARRRRAARSGGGKAAFLGGECGFIFHFWIGEGLRAAGARGAPGRSPSRFHCPRYRVI